MKHTFKCDEDMLITIPLRALEGEQEGELMPDAFPCVFRDAYKVLITKGKPKRVGVAQAIVGLFVLTLALIQTRTEYIVPLHYFHLMFMLSGMLTVATGISPYMTVAKLSFISNIISFFWSLAAVACQMILSVRRDSAVSYGIHGVILAFLVVEMGLTVYSIYWLNQCVCRNEFNTLPVIKLQA